MEQDILELIQCLNSEKEIYIKLGKLSLLKKSMIEKEDIKGLDYIVNQEENFVKKISDIHDKIQSVFERIANHLGQKSDKLTISKIIESIASSNLKQSLQAAAYDLNSTMEKQKKLNKTNQDVLAKKLRRIQALMTTIITENENPTYDSIGLDKADRRQKVNIFDERI